MNRVDDVTLTLSDGREYTLTYNRDSVRYAEKNGFNIAGEPNLSYVYDLFHYAFRAKHKGVTHDFSDNLLDELWGGVAGFPPALIERLALLYAQCYGTLDESEEDVDPLKNGRVTVAL